ncbi:hypothetical protein [Sporosarcina highlanderae]|uniref:Uncharacterized protein n=1 Tax=Sporosarcina highlanderae TaxID=3035916 RepID=A0ABT8JSY0_9BACL|nr:hypothetical protein [Sporosarcina highlanderae]MDN4608220.1 hypothetical protein [Sporosarcina highlanderae]
MPDNWTNEASNWLEKTKEKTLNDNQRISVNGGIAEGRLIGGNVNAMYGFIGTPVVHRFIAFLLRKLCGYVTSSNIVALFQVSGSP